MQSVKLSVADDLREWVKLEAARLRCSESSIIRQALYEKKIRQELGKENGNV